MSWFTYIVRCADDTLYTGVTTDLQRRLKEHNQCDEKGAKYTRTRRPVKLIHNETFENRSQACQREAAIKKLSRQKKLELLAT
ncbi:GIY-YIG nuclease family protein [Oceaniserpentilla sp. 4NH20-0058]